MLYFAYGSNMEWDRMRSRCPQACFRCCARLPDHRLAFTRKSVANRSSAADILTAAGSDVWGVVYDITESDREALDRHESVATAGYRPVQIRVVPSGNDRRSLEAMTYVVVSPLPTLPGPTAKYLGRMIRGATHWGLPTDYIRFLGRIETS